MSAWNVCVCACVFVWCVCVPALFRAGKENSQLNISVFLSACQCHILGCIVVFRCESLFCRVCFVPTDAWERWLKGSVIRTDASCGLELSHISARQTGCLMLLDSSIKACLQPRGHHTARGHIPPLAAPRFSPILRSKLCLLLSLCALSSLYVQLLPVSCRNCDYASALLFSTVLFFAHYSFHLIYTC